MSDVFALCLCIYVCVGVRETRHAALSLAACTRMAAEEAVRPYQFLKMGIHFLFPREVMYGNPQEHTRCIHIYIYIYLYLYIFI
jgi:hypothetical protein